MVFGQDMTRASRTRVASMCRAFTLLELVITLVVVTLLVGLLTPALGAARETANRLSCASGQYGLGSAMSLYAKDYKDLLPPSYFGLPHIGKPQEMMAATTGIMGSHPDQWEGLGWLATNAYGYVDSDKCFFCPSHRGAHTSDAYPMGFALGNPKPCYTNYHYAGDLDPKTNQRRRIDQPWSMIFLTDGLRTKSDYNHQFGGNRLHGDLSISWWQDRFEIVISMLPDHAVPTDTQVPMYIKLWDMIADAP